MNEPGCDERYGPPGCDADICNISGHCVKEAIGLWPREVRDIFREEAQPAATDGGR